jgi:hypothetical protein
VRPFGQDAACGARGVQTSGLVKDESRSSPSTSTRLHPRQAVTASAKVGTSGPRGRNLTSL